MTSFACPQTDELAPHDIAILREDIAYADAVASGLGDDLLRFVLTGQEAPALSDIGSLDKSKLFHAVAPRNYRFSEQTTAEKKRVQSRMRLHDLERFDPLVMIRFGYLVALGRTCGLGTYSLPGVDTTPPWLPALFELDQDFPDPNGRRLLSASRCLAMLEVAESSIRPLVECLFVANRAAYGRYHEWALTLPGLAEALENDPPVVLDVMRDLDVAAKIALINFIGTSGLLREPRFLDAAFGWTAVRKGIDKAAFAALALAPKPMVRVRIECHLASRAAAERLIGVRVAACLPNPGARLDAHATVETSKVVLQAIEEARVVFARTSSPRESAADDDTRTDGPDGYWAADGSYVEAPPLVTGEPSQLAPDAVDALAACIAEINAAASAEHETQRKQPWPEPNPHGVPADGSMRDFWIDINARNEKERLARIAVLSAPYVPLLAPGEAGRVLDIMTCAAKPELGRRFYSSYSNFVRGGELTKARAFATKRFHTFLARPDIDWRHLTRLLLIDHDTSNYAWSNFVFGVAAGARESYHIGEVELLRRIAGGADMRGITALLAEHGIGEDWLLERMLQTGSGLHCRGPDSWTLWPVLAGHFDKLDKAVAAAVAPTTDYRIKSALALLNAFPKLPRRYLKLVLDAAMGGDKPLRALARTLVWRVANLLAVLTPMVDASEAPRRLSAIRWIGDLRDPAAIPPLRAALAAKRSIVDRAAIIAALQACGDDIADLFAPTKLLDEARAGLKKTKSDFSALFDVEALPILHWTDGSVVAPDLVRWWFTMAHKLKQPGGDTLLHMALDRLAPDDAARLGETILSAFVAYDTRQPDVMEAEADAKAGVAARMNARGWDKIFTREQAFVELRAEKLGSYSHSGHEHRGLLALARHAPGPVAAAQARHLLVKHWRRTPQGKAMLDYLASNPAPTALQVLIGVSQRHRTAAVQAYAAAIADRLAEERGWTRDDLEDRTVPTGDLDAAGGANLPIGGALFRAMLDDAGALALRNPEGKTIAALPAPKGEAAEEAKAAKVLLAKLRKEIKLTVEAQSRRLYEAMCAGRVWRPIDFQAFILAHPIVGRLARRLVFVGLDAEQAPLRSFRALADGTLTDAADASIAWDGIAGICIAHRARIGDEEAERWVAHLADYEVAPLFDQLTRPFQKIAARDPATPSDRDIDDRRGFMLDTFGLRGAATKLDYVRASVEDGGAFYAYEKRFERAGIGVVVDFSGSWVPETQRTCALGVLTFVKLQEGKGGFASPQIPLDEVPPILLSEGWNDYWAMAAAGTGFDPDWEKKTR